MFRFINYFQSSLMLISTFQEVELSILSSSHPLEMNNFNTSNKFRFAFISPSVLFVAHWSIRAWIFDDKLINEQETVKNCFLPICVCSVRIHPIPKTFVCWLRNIFDELFSPE
mmetsp:Transcript_41026/g.49296  ORF Transcript_41026/g.49296 Transcript_41026/m.49296 type:complete len:113 (+) Transcript_41026:229-567(+)